MMEAYMDQRLARIIANAAVCSAREFGDVAPLLKDLDSDALAEQLKDAIGACVYETYETVLQPIFAQFPELKAEFDENLRQFGRTC
jgi:hypothetical protein